MFNHLNNTMLPTDLLKMIWHFTYNVHPPSSKLDPWRDLLQVLDIQLSIPACLLRDRMPSTQFQTEEGKLFQVFQLFPPNPYRKGNPYLPTSCVTHLWSPWSQVGQEIFRLLSKEGIHKLRTYSAVLRRKYNKHINRPIFQWNDSLRELFGNPELHKPENYNLTDCKFAYEFKHHVLLEISKARYLTA